MPSAEDRFRLLPPVQLVLDHPTVAAVLERFPRERVVEWTRTSLEGLRRMLAGGDSALNAGGMSRDELVRQSAEMVEGMAQRDSKIAMRPVINATGIVLHTNLGRAPLADVAAEAVRRAARTTNVEVDLETGDRRSRGHQLDAMWTALTGAEASLVVNNCAGATLLALQSLASQKEVVVSRGQLIEIGGSYRLPDVFRLSGAVLREVGTTNRTRIDDYRSAVGSNTGALLLVHPSNFRVVGFTEEVGVGELADLAREVGVPLIHDVGSGCLIDLAAFGLRDEPVVRDSIAAGADLVLFSGDKLLGGPQSGIIVGRRAVVDRLRKSPLARTLRVDKLTLAALEGTLRIYLAGNPLGEIPVLRQLTIPSEELRERAARLQSLASSLGIVRAIGVEPTVSAVGGGSFPNVELPSWGLWIDPTPDSADDGARRLRTGSPGVFARIEKDALVLDLRTVFPDEEDLLIEALARL